MEATKQRYEASNEALEAAHPTLPTVAKELRERGFRVVGGRGDPPRITVSFTDERPEPEELAVAADQIMSALIDAGYKAAIIKHAWVGGVRGELMPHLWEIEFVPAFSYDPSKPGKPRDPSGPQRWSCDIRKPKQATA